jgi:hypothetical protein
MGAAVDTAVHAAVDLGPQLQQRELVASPQQQPEQRPLTVIEHAMRSGATADQLERLLELQVRADNHALELMREKRRMDKEDKEAAAKHAMDAALTKFRGFNVIVPKTKEVNMVSRNGGQGPTFKQSEFDVVCSMLSPALSECGLSFRHDMRFDVRDWKADGSNPAIPAGTAITIPWVYVTCFLTHSDGHEIRLDLDGPPDTSGSKNPLQEMQSTASYLKRQSLLAITGTATGGEDDENRMRPRAAAAGQADNKADARAELIQAGNDKAMQGMKPLTAWWGALTSKQRTDLSKEFAAMRRAAQVADQQGGKRE